MEWVWVCKRPIIFQNKKEVVPFETASFLFKDGIVLCSKKRSFMKLRFKQRINKLFFLVFLITTGGSFPDSVVFSQTFTIPVFPDTQTEIRFSPDMFYSQINWLKEKKDSLNIPIVLHVGDVVDLNNNHEWDIASEGFDILDDAGIYYAIAPGNHDNQSVGSTSRKTETKNRNADLRMTDKFNAYFPVHRFQLQRGRLEAGKSDNAYYTFRAGGLDWLVIALEFNPRKDVINWAETIIEGHPFYNVVILTHYFLRESESGGIIGKDVSYGNRSPEELNDLLVKKHKNVLLVISGHTNSSAWRIGEGDQGNKIYQILQDYQARNYDFGGGFLRLLTVDIKNKTISAKMYSPFLNETKEDKSSFKFSNVDFIKSQE